MCPVAKVVPAAAGTQFCPAYLPVLASIAPQQAASLVMVSHATSVGSAVRRLRRVRLVAVALSIAVNVVAVNASSWFALVSTV